MTQKQCLSAIAKILKKAKIIKNEPIRITYDYGENPEIIINGGDKFLSLINFTEDSFPGCCGISTLVDFHVFSPDSIGVNKDDFNKICAYIIHWCALDIYAPTVIFTDSSRNNQVYKFDEYLKPLGWEVIENLKVSEKSSKAKIKLFILKK